MLTKYITLLSHSFNGTHGKTDGHKKELSQQMGLKILTREKSCL